MDEQEGNPLHRGTVLISSTCFDLTAAIPLARSAGGIVADEMGMGKTLQAISLVMATLAPNEAAALVCVEGKV
jgi:nitrate/nitrite transporter NarK